MTNRIVFEYFTSVQGGLWIYCFWYLEILSMWDFPSLGVPLLELLVKTSMGPFAFLLHQDVTKGFGVPVTIIWTIFGPVSSAGVSATAEPDVGVAWVAILVLVGEDADSDVEVRCLGIETLPVAVYLQGAVFHDAVLWPRLKYHRYTAQLSATTFRGVEINRPDLHIGAFGGVVLSFPGLPVDAISVRRVLTAVVQAVQVGAVAVVVPPGAFELDGTATPIISVFGAEGHLIVIPRQWVPRCTCERNAQLRTTPNCSAFWTSPPLNGAEQFTLQCTKSARELAGQSSSWRWRCSDLTENSFFYYPLLVFHGSPEVISLHRINHTTEWYMSVDGRSIGRSTYRPTGG